MRIHGSTRTRVAAAALALAVPLIGAAGASVAGASGSADRAAPRTTTSTGCFGSVGLKAVGSNSTQQITTPVGSFRNLAGARASVTVPRGASPDCLIVTFSTESLCSGPSGADCLVQVLDNGVRMGPADQFLHFDTSDLASQSHQWVSRFSTTQTRTHNIQVQVQTQTPDTRFQVDDWTLTLIFQPDRYGSRVVMRKCPCCKGES